MGMACIENISVDVTVFMGSYKFVNMIVEFYNATREFRQFCILVIKSFDPLGTHAWRPWSYLHKWMGFCSINMYLCIWVFTLWISMLAWLWNKFICGYKLSHLCFTNREKVDVQGLPYVCIQNLSQFQPTRIKRCFIISALLCL